MMHLGSIHRYCFTIVLIFLFSPSFSQDKERIDIVLQNSGKQTSISLNGYDISIDYSVENIGFGKESTTNGDFYKIFVDNHIPSSIVGAPELPVFSNLIVVPDGSTHSVTISDVVAKRIDLADFNIKVPVYPVQEGAKTGNQDEFQINNKIYLSDNFYGLDTVGIQNIGITRGENLANLTVSPIRYNPSANTLDIIISMRVEISFTSNDPEGKSARLQSPVFRQLLSKSAVNYNLDDVTPGYSEQPVKMIILTDTAFLKALKPFIKWKNQKGIETIVVTKGKQLAGTTYSEIKETLKEIYNSSAQHPDYLLIVGNTSIIPRSTSNNITDMYYGEFDGNTDYIPELLIGRLPAADTSDVKNMVNKIIQYEQYLFDEGNTFSTNALAFAGVESSTSSTNIMNGQINYAIDNYLLPANNIVEHHFFSTKTIKDSVLNIINSGVSFINYTGHGTSSGWSNVRISTSDVDSLTNANKYPVIISNACETSRFTTNSLGNVFVKSKNKGAVAFIGSSQSTYWNEDFYWAVGTGSPGDTPTYGTTGLGAYDRLFHTHEETPSEWFTSLGEIVYAGNLSVSASTSNRKKLYWEIYNIVGDPSLTPVIGTPDSIRINLPDTIPNHTRSLSFVHEPFAYAAVSLRDSLLSASHLSSSGYVNLQLPDLTNDSILIVVTAQNKIPFIKTIFINELQDEYINISSHSFSDNTGNNNGMVESGELVHLNMTLENLGMEATSNLDVTLRTSSRWVTLSGDSIYNVGTLNCLSSIDIGSFAFTVADSIPDNVTLLFDVLVKDDYEEKHFEIRTTTHAPSLSIISNYYNDTEYGNGNFIPDPGETLKIVYVIKNDGSVTANGSLQLSTNNSNITISDTPAVAIPAHSTVEVPVNITLSSTLAIGTTININSLFTDASYSASSTHIMSIGDILESFEKGNTTSFPWSNESATPWFITSSYSYNGLYAAQSGNINNGQSTTISIKAHYPQDDTISFYYKVSSEDDYDILSFSINGKNIMERSGDLDWAKISFKVQAGINLFEWKYTKDQSVFQNLDCAFIDLIDFTKYNNITFYPYGSTLHDLYAASILSPEDAGPFNIESVTAKIVNQGIDTINGFDLAYTVNNSTPVVQHFNDTIVSMDSVNVSFDEKYDFTELGTYSVNVFCFSPDDNIQNDTASLTFTNNGNDIELVEILSPMSNSNISPTTISVNIANHGPDTVNSIRLAYVINDSIICSQIFRRTLLPNSEIVTLSFDQTIDLFASVFFNIQVFSEYQYDANTSNDTLTFSFINNIPDNMILISARAYPNPFTSDLYLDIDSHINDNLTLTIVDMSGKRIQETRNMILEGKSVIRIDAGGLVRGIYFLRITSKNYNETLKIVKQ